MIRYQLVFVVVLLIAGALVSISPVAWSQSDAATQELDLEFWKTIKGSNDPAEFRAYLAEFPDGKFAAIATIRLKKLEQDESPTSSSNSTSAEPKTSSTSTTKTPPKVKLTPDQTVAQRPWCGLSNRAIEVSVKECLSLNGVPTQTKTDAEWVFANYFTKYKNHKAFAISNDTFGMSAFQYNSQDAKEMALLDCSFRAVNARTCRVINVNGDFIQYTDASTSSHSAFSSFGNLADLAGRYSLRSGPADMEGYLDVKVQSGKIELSAELCPGSGALRCATYESSKIYEERRGRYVRAQLNCVNNPAARWPGKWSISVSFSSDTGTLKTLIGPYSFDGKRISG